MFLVVVSLGWLSLPDSPRYDCKILSLCCIYKERKEGLAILEYVHTLEHSAEAQFELIMKQYLGPVFRFVYFQVKNHAVAEDLTQDVFVKVFKQMGSFRRESSLKTWIYKIALNEVRMYQRSRWFRRFVLFEKIDEAIAGGQESSAPGRLEQEEVLQVVLALSANYRQIILLHYYQDLAVSEIAEILGISHEAVYTRLHRAKKQLKERLAKEGAKWM